MAASISKDIAAPNGLAAEKHVTSGMLSRNGKAWCPWAEVNGPNHLFYETGSVYENTEAFCLARQIVNISNP